MFCASSTASAQYFEPGRQSSGYFPDSQQRYDYGVRASPPMDEASGPPDLRFGIGLDLGFGLFAFPSLDEELLDPNDADTLNRRGALAFDVNGFAEFVQTLRLGFLAGMRGGGTEDTSALQSFFALGADVGHVSRYGWAFFAGGGVGVGLFHSESVNRFDEYYEYDAAGLWVRGHLRVERQLNPYIALRLTGLYERTFIRSDEVYIDVPIDAPDPVLGDPDGDTDNFGAMFGVVFTTF